MTISKILYKIVNSVVLCATVLSMTGCKDEPAPSINPENAESVTLVYAVASNNLYSNLIDDMWEMQYIAPSLNLSKNVVLVYYVNPNGQCTLQKLTVQKGVGSFAEIKKYDDTPLSVEKDRISEVIDDVQGLYPNASHGIIFWSHASGWRPWFPAQNDQEFRRTFGSDNYEGVNYQCNITDLAEAIPDHAFKYIWFDCCYMGNIETYYQLRKKADYVAGYPTEIYDAGMPYELTLPYLAKREPDLVGAANQLFDYYMQNPYSRLHNVTVSVVRTDLLEGIAEAARPFYTEGFVPTSLLNVNNYSRYVNYPFYDLEQLLYAYQGMDNETRQALADALEDAIIVRKISDTDFDHRPLNLNDYSAISVNNYKDTGSRDDLFYTTLDWYIATRQK